MRLTEQFREERRKISWPVYIWVPEASEFLNGTARSDNVIGIGRDRRRVYADFPGEIRTVLQPALYVRRLLAPPSGAKS